MSDSVAILIGAAVSGLVGVLVVALQHVLQLRSEAAGVRARRLSEFTAAAWGAFDDLGPTARASTDSKEARKAELGTREAWDRFNAAFAQVQVLETKDVYDAATSVQHEMVRCKRLATETEWDPDSWRAEREPLFEKMLAFQRVARAALGTGTVD